MAPTLRSAQNTPSKNSTTRDTYLSTPSRKIPICSKCKRPRTGHPRSGCPYVDQREETPPPTQSTEAPAPTNLVDAIGSMVLASPAQPEETKPVINRRRSSVQPRVHASLMSLNQEEQEIVDKLFDGRGADEGETQEQRTARWCQTLTSPKKVMKQRVKMPGALDAPSPYSSFATDPASLPPSQPASHAVITGSQEVPFQATARFQHSTPRVQPLARTLSAEERDLFTAALTKYSDATVYAVPAADVHILKASAVRMNFYARVVTSKDGKDPQALLILGREEDRVNQLAEKVEVERQKSGSSLIRTIAQGAVVGAVGTFATLAFA